MIKIKFYPTIPKYFPSQNKWHVLMTHGKTQKTLCHERGFWNLNPPKSPKKIARRELPFGEGACTMLQVREVDEITCSTCKELIKIIQEI